MALDFPTSPTVGQKYPASPVTGVPTYTWDGEKWTTVGGAMGGKTPVWTDGSVPMTAQLTLVNPPVSTTDAAAKAYVDSNDRAKKNYIINGAMMVSQENGSAAGNLVSVVYYSVDQFAANAGGVSGTLTAAQVASLTPGGSPNRLRLTVTAADASVAATDLVQIFQQIEGGNVADLKFGTAAAKTVTLQYGCRGPAGTHCVAISNSGRSYVVPVTISAGEANTDVVKSVTIPGDITGTWLTSNGVGFDIRWFLMGGSTYQTATPNTWLSSVLYCTSAISNFMGTNGNVFELFDVGLYEGSAAPAFQMPNYASELALCKRYLRLIIPEGAGIASDANNAYFTIRHDGMRATPTVSATAALTISNVVNANSTQSAPHVGIFASTPDWGHYQFGFFSGLSGFNAQAFRVGGYVKLNARM